MIIVSNHLSTIGMKFSDDTIIRINLAWAKDFTDAEKILQDWEGWEIYLDYPQGRTKPPKPNITLEQAIELSIMYDVEYFAVSNVEKVEDVEQIYSSILVDTELVPKIESEVGVRNMPAIASLGIKFMMLDKEDLYTDVGNDSIKFDELTQLARTQAKDLGIKLLELQGVIFS